MIPWLDADAVERALPWEPLIEALAAAFARLPDDPLGARAPLRAVHRLDGLGGAPAAQADGAQPRLLMMPAWNARHLGVKLVNVVPANRARGAASVSAVYLLFGADGAPRALIDGPALTARRTAAASALAARHLARGDARTLLMVGTGELAPHLVDAHRAVRAYERVLVWGRRAAAATALADRLAARLAAPVQAVADLAAALGAADTICCATTSTEPLVRAAQVRPGAHVDLVGAFAPSMRESDAALVARARVFVDTREGALAEAGDLVQAIAEGAFAPERVAADLSELVRGAHPGRASAAELTLFKSVGTALEDLAAAELVLARMPPARGPAPRAG